MAASIWKSIPCKISELRLDRTLACGQSFRWKEYTPGVWTGVIGHDVWQLKQTDTHLWYKVHKHMVDDKTSVVKPLKQESHHEPSIKTQENLENQRKKHRGINVKSEKLIVKSETGEDVDSRITTVTTSCAPVNKLCSPAECKQDEDILSDYFQLNVKLEELYKSWGKADEHFRHIGKEFSGIRMLRQNPVECLFSFICSSNNHISRISSMVEKLALHFGNKISVPYHVDDKDFYTFPEISALASDGVEERLRGLGFGYRAKYIQQSARYIEENGGQTWLYRLRDVEYIEAKKHLIKLCGVGAKVADCVLLMCLDKPGSIPVDTHVWQIASRNYMPKLTQAKSLTDKLYDEIGDYLRDLWGPYAGWAHSVLFTADLKQFKQNKEVKETKPIKRKGGEKVQAPNEKIKRKAGRKKNQ